MAGIIISSSLYNFFIFRYKINNITYGAFENMVQLQNLDLSGNDLKYIPSGAFIGMLHREFVNAISCFNHNTVFFLPFLIKRPLNFSRSKSPG